MSGLDILLGASVEAVKKSGALEDTALMAAVSAVNADGTVDVTRAGDTYPAVRLLNDYAPVAGDLVQILKGRGGWVCLGRQATADLSAWTPLPLATGWTAFGSPYAPPAYRVMANGFVALRGMADHAGTTTASTIGTLPLAARPLFKHRFVTQVSTTLYASLDVNTDGTVVVGDLNGGTATWASLDPAYFSLT